MKVETYLQEHRDIQHLDVFARFKELQQQYQPDALDFEYCVGYLFQAARNGLHVVSYPKTEVIYTRKSRAQDSEPVIIAAAGEDRIAAIKETARYLRGSCGKDIIIKNVGKDLEESTPLFQQKKCGLIDFIKMTNQILTMI